MKILKAITFASTFLAGSGAAFATEVQYDKSVAEAAEKLAAEKIGNIRSSITYDKKPVIIQPKPTSEKREIKEEASDIDSQRITDLNPGKSDDLDYTLTGSIERHPAKFVTKVVWETFDVDGNPVR